MTSVRKRGANYASGTNGERDIDCNYDGSKRRVLLLLDSEGMRCRRAAVIDISSEILDAGRSRAESTTTAVARIRMEYEQVGWVCTSLLWRGVHRRKFDNRQ